MKQTRVWVVGVIAALAAGPSCSGPSPIDDAGGSDAASNPVDTGRADTGGGDAGTADSGTAPVGTLVLAAVGGLVDSADGLFTIYVPPGALASDTTISIQRLGDSDVPSEVLATEPLGGVYAVEPDGLVFGGEGAIGWFHFASVPASLIRPAAPGVPESRAVVFGNARPRDGGAITEDGTPRTVYRADGRIDAYVSLQHLSLHWASRHGQHGEHWLGVDFGAEVHEVGVTWRATEVFRTTEVTAGTIAGAYARDGHPVSASTANGWTAVSGFPLIVSQLIGDLLGLLDAPGAESRSSPAGGFAPDVDHLVSPGPSWRCDDVGVSVLTANLVLSGADGPFAYVSIESPASCVAASAIEASIIDTVECRREDTRVTCADAPALIANVTARPATTTTEPVAGTPFFVTLSPTGDPPAAGPATITATEGGATMTATRDATTGTYATSLDPLFDVTATATWTTTGATPTALDPPLAASLSYGPNLGLDTDVVFGAVSLDQDVTFTIEVPRMLCHGVSSDDVTISGTLTPVDVGGGASGLDAPARAAIDALSLHCGTPASTITASPFYIDVGTSSMATLDAAGTPVRVSTGQSIRVAGTALLASCPAGRTYCTSACVNLAADPLNCGGCGVVGAEICDGLDNNCNGRADDGCPVTFGMSASGAVTSPVYGTPVAGHSSQSLACPTYQVIAGFRGREVGPIWQLAPYCTGVAMRVDRTAVPYRYSIVAAPVTPPGMPWSGSTGGGTGTTFDTPCPTDMMVDGVTVQADTNLGTMQLQCVQWEVRQSAGGPWQLVRGATTTLALVGSGTGTSYTWIAPLHSSGTPELINGGTMYYGIGTPIEAISFTTITATFRLSP